VRLEPEREQRDAQEQQRDRQQTQDAGGGLHARNIPQSTPRSQRRLHEDPSDRSPMAVPEAQNLSVAGTERDATA
jgi:hypothetical protein